MAIIALLQKINKLGHFTYNIAYHTSQLREKGQIIPDCTQKRRGGLLTSTFSKMEI
jgi:hypothetical protein